MSNGKFRQTARKDLIHYMLNTQYHNKPVLLEELRWKVFLREKPGDLTNNIYENMTVSYTKSFARTIRAHMPNLGVYKIRRPEYLPIGILTQAAMHRCFDAELMMCLTNTDPLYCYVQYKTPRSVDHNNSKYDYIEYVSDSKTFRDRRSMAYFWFCSKLTSEYDKDALFKKCVPINLNLTFISDNLNYESFVTHITTRCKILRVNSTLNGNSIITHKYLPLYIPNRYCRLVDAYSKKDRYKGVPRQTLLKRVVRREAKKLVIKPKKKNNLSLLLSPYQSYTGKH